MVTFGRSTTHTRKLSAMQFNSEWKCISIYLRMDRSFLYFYFFFQKQTFIWEIRNLIFMTCKTKCFSYCAWLVGRSHVSINNSMVFAIVYVCVCARGVVLYIFKYLCSIVYTHSGKSEKRERPMRFCCVNDAANGECFILYIRRRRRCCS